jgi:hypothetical protein
MEFNYHLPWIVVKKRSLPAGKASKTFMQMKSTFPHENLFLGALGCLDRLHVTSKIIENYINTKFYVFFSRQAVLFHIASGTGRSILHPCFAACFVCSFASLTSMVIRNFWT